MRTLTFANRNFKEIIRDPLSIIFAIILPLFLLYIFQQFKIPSEVYRLENFTPGIIIFGFSFISLFTATLISKDRESALLIRLGVTPLKSIEYILGYTLAVIPIVIMQNILFFIVAIILGLEFNINIIYTILSSMPISLLFIALGILVGSITSSKASSGASSIVVQLVAFTSGMYFSTDMIGEVFTKICNILPFARCTMILKGILNGNYYNLVNASIILLLYILIIFIISIIIFKKKRLK